jgi:predicted membrane protein
MKNQISNVLWGLFLVLIGLGFAGNVFNLWNFELFFNGWWTLFIIIPCFISMIQNGIHLWNTLGLIFGILLLIASQGFINSQYIWDLLFPIIIISIGLSIIFKGKLSKNAKIINNLKHDGLPNYSAVFGAQDLQIHDELFEGASISAIFGGVKLDLRQTTIEHDIYITSTAVFGGIEIIVPQNVRIEISSTPIFGGVSNKTIKPIDDNPKTIYLNSTSIFGGTEIK